uniref:Angioassociated migratory cell protein putative n=1 Tax=Albugo laibachii Nc14 TaxID=890382 RepID=F0W0W7_9STRA|nr:angioassociated migratory cell protein putative [Albugo laibachii Nc14]|eukprot:CCA14691.1 angioassociated migratory cell protein putative [Albugo laibachii Nc14]
MVADSSLEDVQDQIGDLDLEIIADDETMQEFDIGEAPESEDDHSSGEEMRENDASNDQAVMVFAEHHAPVYAVATHPSNTSLVLSGGGDDRGILWNRENGQVIHAFNGHQDSVVATGFSFDGKYAATGGYDGIILVWDTITGALSQKLEGPSQEVEWISWHQRGYILLAGSADGTIWMWLATTGECMQVFAGHEQSVTCGSFTSSGKMIISGSSDATVRVWNPKTGECNQVFRGYRFHDGPICCVVCHPLQPMAISCSQDGSACLLQLQTGRVLATFTHVETNMEIGGTDAEQARNSVECAGFCKAMNWAATGCLGGLLRIWDLASLQCRHTCRHEGGVIKLLWHPTEAIVYTCTVTGLIYAWDARSGSQLRVWQGHSDMILDMSFVMNGDQIAGILTTSDDETVRVLFANQRRLHLHAVIDWSGITWEMTDPIAVSEKTTPARSFRPRQTPVTLQESDVANDPVTASHVFFRIKRKRNETPHEQLLVRPDARAKKLHTELNDTKALTKAFQRISTAENCFLFKRMETVENHAMASWSKGTDDSKWIKKLKNKANNVRKQQRDLHREVFKKEDSHFEVNAVQNRFRDTQSRAKRDRQAEVEKFRVISANIQQQDTITVSGKVCLVDFMVTNDDCESTEASDITMNGQKLGAIRVLNPMQREVDEAIWKAFQQNDFSAFFQILHCEKAEQSMPKVLNFARPLDGSTVLMAAAFHGRVDVIESLLQVTGIKVLLRDLEGSAASDFAARNKHLSVQEALIACETTEREKAFVYDLYCVESVPTTSTTESLANDGLDIPVVHVNETVQQWLVDGLNNFQKAEDGEIEDFVFDSDNSIDQDEDGESLNSNDEDYYLNDYPDEESSSSTDLDEERMQSANCDFGEIGSNWIEEAV